MRVFAMLVVLAVAGASSPPARAAANPAQEEGKKESKKQKKAQKKTEKKEAAAPSGAPGLDPAAMEEMMKLTQPGAEHKKLEPLVGEWITAVTMTFPGAPPMKSGGTCSRKWILGNRYVEEVVKGEFMNMPFEGRGIMGYDNVLKQYVSTWMDTMGTGFMSETGQSDAAGKEFSLKGDYPDPATGKPKRVRSILKVEGKDKHVLTMFETEADGKENQTLEIVFTRKK